MKSVKDVSGRSIHVGDPVCVLPDIELSKKIGDYMDSLLIGVVHRIRQSGQISVKVGSVGLHSERHQLSKIDLKDKIDDVIARLAQDIETLQLQKESDILNSMLDPTEL